MITPSSNIAIEPITTRIFAALGEAVTVHFTRIRVTHISLEPSSRDQFTADFGLILITGGNPGLKPARSA